MDCIFNGQELELAVDEEVHLLVEVKLDALDVRHLLDVLSHEWSVSCLESLPGKRSENVDSGDLITSGQRLSTGLHGVQKIFS